MYRHCYAWPSASALFVLGLSQLNLEGPTFYPAISARSAKGKTGKSSGSLSIFVTRMQKLASD